MKPLLVGEAPSRVAGTLRAFDGRSGAFLQTLLGDGIDFSSSFDLVNLLETWPGRKGKGSTFPSVIARKAAARLAIADRRVIFCGKRVAAAAGFTVTPYLEWRAHRGGSCAVLPHPSAVNRWYNSLKNREIAAAFLRAAVTEDHAQPIGRWTFDQSVADAFDDMLRRSIPQYDVMRKAVFDVGRRYIQPGTAVVDLGCSRGEAFASFIDAFAEENQFVGVEVSEPMHAAACARFRDRSDVTVYRADLRTFYPPGLRASLTLCVLTLQFVPIEHRHHLLSSVYESTVPGGAVVLVEKVLGRTHESDAAMVSAYLDLKRANGYSAEDVARKRLALEGVLVPITARWNEDLLEQAGFRHVECFWRWMCFAAWIAVRSGSGRG